MEDKKDLMVQMVYSFAQGCGELQVSDEACIWFQERYYGWIDTVKKNKEAENTSPRRFGAGRAKLSSHSSKRSVSLRQEQSDGTIEKSVLRSTPSPSRAKTPCPWCPDRE